MYFPERLFPPINVDNTIFPGPPPIGSFPFYKFNISVSLFYIAVKLLLIFVAFVLIALKLLLIFVAFVLIALKLLLIFVAFVAISVSFTKIFAVLMICYGFIILISLATS